MGMFEDMDSILQTFSSQPTKQSPKSRKKKMTSKEYKEWARHFSARRIAPEPVDWFSAFFGAAAIVLAVAGLWL